MGKFLDKKGIEVLWNKIKEQNKDNNIDTSTLVTKKEIYNQKVDYNGQDYVILDDNNGTWAINGYHRLKDLNFSWSNKDDVNLKNDPINKLYGGSWRMPTKEEFEKLMSSSKTSIYTKSFNFEYNDFKQNRTGAIVSNGISNNGSMKQLYLPIYLPTQEEFGDYDHSRTIYLTSTVSEDNSGVYALMIEFKGSLTPVIHFEVIPFSDLIDSNNYYYTYTIAAITDENIVFLNDPKYVSKEELYITGYDTNGYDYVDMGEAGIWATCNIGATKVTDTGLVFQYGVVKGYNVTDDKPTVPNGFLYYSDYIKHIRNTLGMGVFNIALTEFDAAHVNMGGQWQMPTVLAFRTLKNLCDYEFVENYQKSGINVGIFTLKTDETKKLYFPINAYRSSEDKGEYNDMLFVTNSGVMVDDGYDDDGFIQQYLPIRACIPANVEPVKIPKYLTKEEAKENYATKKYVDEKIEEPLICILEIVDSKVEQITDYPTINFKETVNTSSIKGDIMDLNTLYELVNDIGTGIKRPNSIQFYTQYGDPITILGLVKNRSNQSNLILSYMDVRYGYYEICRLAFSSEQWIQKYRILKVAGGTFIGGVKIEN